MSPSDMASSARLGIPAVTSSTAAPTQSLVSSHFKASTSPLPSALLCKARGTHDSALSYLEGLVLETVASQQLSCLSALQYCLSVPLWSRQGCQPVSLLQELAERTPSCRAALERSQIAGIEVLLRWGWNFGQASSPAVPVGQGGVFQSVALLSSLFSDERYTYLTV